MRRILDALAPLALIALLLAGWEAACRIWQVPAYFLPTPSAVAAALATDTGSLVSAAWNTLSTALLALVIASLAAQALALLVGLSPVLERAIRPLASTLQVTPVVAIAPLVIIWAGIDHPERAVVALARLFRGVAADPGRPVRVAIMAGIGRDGAPFSDFVRAAARGLDRHRRRFAGGDPGDFPAGRWLGDPGGVARTSRRGVVLSTGHDRGRAHGLAAGRRV